MPTVLVVDPFELRRAAIASFLEPWANQYGVRILSVGPADAATLDGLLLRMVIVVLGRRSIAEASVLDWVSAYAAIDPGTPVAVLSERDDPDEVVAAFRAGARGFVPMSSAPSTALPALTFVLSGGTFFPPAPLGVRRVIASAPPPSLSQASVELTTRQHEVLDRLREGHTNKLIGRQMKLRESTVKVHVRHIMRKMGVRNRTQAAVYGPVAPSGSKAKPNSSSD